MCVVILYGNLVVLVNMCETQEISIERGLKQGYPFSLFFFFLLVQSLLDTNLCGSNCTNKNHNVVNFIIVPTRIALSIID